MVLALQIVLAACFMGIAVDLLVDVNKNHKGECSKASKKLWAQGMIVGIIANFLDTLGCGSFAPSTFVALFSGRGASRSSLQANAPFAASGFLWTT